jgi:hypothetical protein
MPSCLNDTVPDIPSKRRCRSKQQGPRLVRAYARAMTKARQRPESGQGAVTTFMDSPPDSFVLLSNVFLLRFFSECLRACVMVPVLLYDGCKGRFCIGLDRVVTNEWQYQNPPRRLVKCVAAACYWHWAADAVGARLCI